MKIHQINANILIEKPKIASLITVLLLLSSAFLILTPQTNAQVATEQPTAGELPSGANPSISIDTIPYLSFSPNPIGANQTLLVNMWLIPPINVQRTLKDAFQVTITKPDKTQEVIGPISSYQGDATAWFSYVPKQAGNYTIKLDFLGQYYPAGRYLAGVIVTNSSGTNLNSAYYKPSSTAEQLLIVQEDMVASWPTSPLPTDYWTRPVSVDHREWWPILGNYPATGYGPAIHTGAGPSWDELYPDTNPYWSSSYSFVPYVQAPNSSHVVWKRQGGFGGLIGGVFGDINLRTNPGYPSIIYQGRCYQVQSGVVNGVTQDVWQCYDLRTGEVYWEKINSNTFSTSQAPTIITYTERTSQQVAGEEAMMRGLQVSLMYIGGGRMIKYDPWTGAVIANVSISPLSSSTYYLHEYALGVQSLGGGKYALINWTTNGAANDLTSRIISNISWPISSLPATTDFNVGITVYPTAENPPDSLSGTGVSIGQRMVGINIKTGQVMWNITTTAADGHEQFFTTNNAIVDNGVIINRMITGEIKAWDIYTGNLKWTTPLNYPWGVFGGYHIASAYGLYFVGSYDGYHAINETTGKIEWTFHAYTPYQFETGYQTTIGSAEYVFHGGMQVADGKVYIYSMEHTQSQPTTRGLKLFALDVFSGQELWNFSGSECGGGRSFTGAIADGYLAWASSLDSIMYVFGKGKSAVTIEAPLTTITLGQSLVLKGTVLDQSPAQPSTPCVAKESMNAWMNYLHNQGDYPSEVFGVPVSIDAVDPNGNFIHIADVTSEGNGMFSYIWEPEIAGKYSVTATFMGDDSYGSSYSQTAVGVVEAPQATTTPVQIANYATTSDVMTYSLVAAVAVIIAVALAVVLLLKKR
ncbi:MAG: PQQ-binding-like beta-propeller repeat protein [Candidatus Bathyarchaeia archaeon]